jgi:hypothetical protein
MNLKFLPLTSHVSKWRLIIIFKKKCKLAFEFFQFGPFFFWKLQIESNFKFDSIRFEFLKVTQKWLQWMKSSITLSKHTHLALKIIQIKSFKFFKILNSLKFLITTSKHTLKDIDLQNNKRKLWKSNIKKPFLNGKHFCIKIHF